MYLYFQVCCKNPGLPGLVFDDFDQLYTQNIYADLLAQMTADESEQLEGSEDLEETVELESEDSEVQVVSEISEDSEDIFKLPDAKTKIDELQSKLQFENKTEVFIQYIYEVDYQTIVAIQKLTAEAYALEEETKNHIKKHSNEFRRDENCMKHIKGEYKTVMQNKIKSNNTECPKTLEGVKFLLKLLYSSRIIANR
jgi:hypothetical protein